MLCMLSILSFFYKRSCSFRAHFALEMATGLWDDKAA